MLAIEWKQMHIYLPNLILIKLTSVELQTLKVFPIQIGSTINKNKMEDYGIIRISAGIKRVKDIT